MASLIEYTGGGTVFTDGPSAGKVIPITNPLLDSAEGNETLLWECRDFGVTPKTRLAGTLYRNPLSNVDYLIVPGQMTFVSPMKATNLGSSIAKISLYVKRESGDTYFWEPGFLVGAGQTAHLQIQGFSLLKSSGIEGAQGDALYASVDPGSQFQVYVMGSEAVVLEHQRNTKED